MEGLRHSIAAGRRWWWWRQHLVCNCGDLAVTAEPITAVPALTPDLRTPISDQQGRGCTGQWIVGAADRYLD